jgi:hypothetical protein
VPPVHGRRHHKTKSLQGADLSLYPAFKWCADFGKEWYLPALNELKAIYANKSKLNKILSKIDKPILSSTSTYWSSNETDYEWAYVLFFSNGNSDNDHDKSSTCPVRAIRAL